MAPSYIFIKKMASLNLITEYYVSCRKLLPLENARGRYLVDAVGGIVYQVMDQIGVSLPGHFPVYRVAYMDCFDFDSPHGTVFVYKENPCSVKIIPFLHDMPDSLPIKTARRFPHQTFVRVVSEFLDMFPKDYCVVMEFAEYGSMRKVMANHFPNGLPVACIVFVLRTVLEGLGSSAQDLRDPRGH
ncbi:hypothetical protein DM860_014529 [Cuscuta australis]|uniref:Protein kinase domain-containing protein n=1 Tax=Cuscuta australis TaxID=267555 RepID=A0A328DXW3_9ASTE|nr:hypothetical protein DM860_014529 [Cuscuta australis]